MEGCLASTICDPDGKEVWVGNRAADTITVIDAASLEILADRGINAKVGQGQWDGMVAHIVAGIKSGQQADAICEAVKEVGEVLSQHFPVREDDVDELDNLIIP